MDYNMAEPRNFRAVFAAARSTDIKIVINEINYKSYLSKDTKDWIELYNAGNSTVNLKNWVISDGGPGKWICYSGRSYSYTRYVHSCMPRPGCIQKFLARVTNSTGDMEFGLSSSGDEINLYDPEGNLVDFVNYDIVSPWPTDVNATRRIN